MKDEKGADWEKPPVELADELGNGSLWLFIGGIYKPIFLGLQIHYTDLNALLSALGVPDDWATDAEVPGVERSENERRLQQRLAEHLPAYPLLSRICDMYQHAKYDQEEVPELRRECDQALTVVIENAAAVHGVHKLIYACDRALAVPSRLDLICD